MNTKNNRKHERFDSTNLIYYKCIDGDDNIVAQGMGRTLNVSESGILLETRSGFDIKHDVLIGIGFKDDLVDIKGKVVYSNKHENKKFVTGINFFDFDESTQSKLKTYIKNFQSSTLK